MLHTIFEHNRWADENVLASLRRAPDPPEEALRLFAHVIGAEIIWMDRIDATPQSSAVWPEPDLDAIARIIPELHGRFGACLEAGRLDRPVGYVNSAGHAFTTPVRDILTHVALHGAYHRGQVALILRKRGLEPAPTDFIAFVRGFPAATHRID